MMPLCRWLALLVIALALPGLAAGWLYTRYQTQQLNHLYPPIGELVDVAGQRLHVLDQGSGQSLILLHGANSNLRDFSSRLMPALADDYRLIAVDRPGYGHSPRPEQANWQDPVALARLMLDLCATLDCGQPVLVGHSWSGSIVMAALAEFGHEVRGGVVLSGATGHWAGGMGWTYEMGKLGPVSNLLAHTLVLPAGQIMLDGALEPVLHPQPVPAGYAQDIAVGLALRPETYLANTQDMNRLSEFLQGFSPRYPDIDAPLLFIHGSEDELVPWWNHGQRVTRVLPDARQVMLAGAGHAPHHSHTGQTSAAIRQFLQTLPPDDSARP